MLTGFWIAFDRYRFSFRWYNYFKVNLTLGSLQSTEYRVLIQISWLDLLLRRYIGNTTAGFNVHEAQKKYMLGDNYFYLISTGDI